MTADRFLLRAGFLLFTLALALGLFIPSFLNPRMAVSAHLTGLLNGMLLMILALVWSALRLAGGRARLVRGLFLYGAFANFGGTVLGAVLGTSHFTPQAGAGHTAAPWQEAVVGTILVSLSLAMLLAGLLAVHALRPGAQGGPPAG